MIGIYKITNKVNGKCYIGQSVNIKKRWYKGHKSQIETSDYPLYRSIRKYGIENFQFEVVEECLHEELDEREIYYIKEFNSYIENKNGYNLTKGGGGCAGYKHSQEFKNNMSKIVKGENNYFYGKPSHNNRKIVCLNDGVVYKSLKEFCEKYEVSSSSVSSICSNKNLRNYVIGNNGDKLIVKYYETYVKMTQEEINKEILKISTKYTPKHAVKVMCIDTNEIFNSQADGARKYHTSSTSISDCCKGKQHHAGKDENGEKLTWRYI